MSYEQLSRNYSQMSYSTARASANESWAFFMGRRKFVAARMACQMFVCWLEEAIARRVVTLPSNARFSFQEARTAWGNANWIGSGRMAIDGLKEVQEAVMLIEAGLSTYEKECAKRGDDYQEIFSQQVRETMERRQAGLKPPAWAAAAFDAGLKKQMRRIKMTPELRNLPHIASMAFNEPLLLEPAYARVFFCALAGQLGITRLTDSVSGVTLGAEQIAEPRRCLGMMMIWDPGHHVAIRWQMESRCCRFLARWSVKPVSSALFWHDGLQRNYCSPATGYQ